MNVILVEPFFPSNQREFARALAEAGAAVIRVGETPHYGLDDQLKDWLTHYQQVPSVTDAEAMTGVVRSIQDRVWVDRLEATVEAHTMAGAKVREACGIPGTSVRTAWLCRDKPSVKQALREAGVPTATSTAAGSAAEAHAFAEHVGFPLILKPRSGAGAADTMRVDDDQLNKALLGYGRQGVGSIALEEFVEGHEGTRVAAHDGLSPLFIGSGRAVGAAALAALCLFATRQAVPSTRQWARLAVVAGGVVVGFPLLTSYALTQAPATHGAVVIGLLPAATAVMAVLRGKEHVPVSFRAHAPQVHIEHLPVGGLNVWARLPDGTDVDQLVRECETQGLLVAPGTEWFPAEPSGPFIRLNFSGENPSRLAEAGEVLGNALRTVA